jgi:uncharacterized protein (DUF488 family)
MPGGVTIWSVGHGTRAAEELIAVFRESDIRSLVDVRTAPGSRRHPQFGRDQLSATLEAAGIRYRWEKDLGGWRRPSPDSSHTALRSDQFRGYADHMETATFDAALRGLEDEARTSRTAFMCAETLWRNCHRRMISDALTVAGWDVVHLLGPGKAERHRHHPALRLDGERLVYDVDDGNGSDQAAFDLT